MTRPWVMFALTLLLSGASPAAAGAQTVSPFPIRGQIQALRLYGPRTGDPVIVSSGDGGWLHVGPHVARILAARGFFVIGFDVRAYLEGFTSATGPLTQDEARRDYQALARFAAQFSSKKPLLVGVSEGAGLSVLAASDSGGRDTFAGVVGIGLPDVNELGWRWRDALIYITHRVPNEPTFSAAAHAGQVAPLPLAAIHSTHDEFVPLPQVERVMARAGEPKRMWVVPASDHRFSDNIRELDDRLMEAIEWVRQHTPR